MKGCVCLVVCDCCQGHSLSTWALQKWGNRIGVQPWAHCNLATLVVCVYQSDLGNFPYFFFLLSIYFIK